jgi:hypothetical protein
VTARVCSPAMQSGKQADARRPLRSKVMAAPLITIIVLAIFAIGVAVSVLVGHRCSHP